MPFRGEDYKEVLRKNKVGIINFDEEVWNDISDEAKDLIQKMTELEPRNRLTADEALLHPWFQDNKQGSFIGSSEISAFDLPIDSSSENVSITDSPIMLQEKLSSYVMKPHINLAERESDADFSESEINETPSTCFTLKVPHLLGPKNDRLTIFAVELRNNGTIYNSKGQYSKLDEEKFRKLSTACGTMREDKSSNLLNPYSTEGCAELAKDMGKAVSVEPKNLLYSGSKTNSVRKYLRDCL